MDLKKPINFLSKKKRLLISFSGGKTSWYLAKELLENHQHEWDEIIVAFMNTGAEHPKTLEYVKACDEQWGLKVVWIEAVFNPEKGKGTRHKVVSYESASRNGEPFEEMVKKHGLPNSQFSHCTRETKVYPLRSYLRSIGWEPNSYNTAIGIRFDEMDRISPSAMESGTIYPLIDWRVNKSDVLAAELVAPVRLGIPEHWGNCVWCWKKSNRKLATVARELPQAFNLPAHLETNYKDAGAGFGDKRMFRGRKTTADIFIMAADPSFEPFVDGFPFASEEMDQGMSCGESCEIMVDGAQTEFEL